MDFQGLASLITTVGFPIVCVIGLAIFIAYMIKHQIELNEQNMEKVQARCKEREERLYSELDKSHAVNEKAIETIAHYAEKLDSIQSDIKDIKTDITVIMTKN
jgi:chromosome segregation ATPase